MDVRSKMEGKRGARTSAAADRPLTPERVIDVALGLLDEVGLPGFTMRALANRLDTYPATVYWHVGGRAQILAGVVNLALSEVRVPDPRQVSWEAWLRATARDYRRAIHRHPNVGALVASQLTVSLPAARLVESVMAVLHDAGFRDAALASAFNTFVGSLVGWVSVELSADPGEGDHRWQEEYESVIRALPRDEYPVIVSNIHHLADHVIALRWHSGREKPLDESFDVALETWIQGLSRQLDHPR